MSLRANYFKLGLFVIGAVIAGVAVLLIIGSGRWFTPRLTVESYFNESVQGLAVGSQLKYRGVVVGQVTNISFTYTRYQLDRPMSQRARYVLVESEIEPRLLGGRAAAGDLTSPANAKMEVERGLRIRLAPQGITGTSYLELDYVDSPPPPLPIDWTPEHIYIPSAPSTVQQFVNAASEIIDRLHRLDIEGTIANLNTLLLSLNDKVGALDTKRLQQRTEQTLASIDRTLQGLDTKGISQEAVALLQEVRKTNAELQATVSNPAWKKLPEDASASMAEVRKLVADPRLAATIGHLERTLGRLDRLTGGTQTDLTTTIENLRQITENLRDLSENAKRYPSSVLFGAPPTPLERSAK